MHEEVVVGIECDVAAHINQYHRTMKYGLWLFALNNMAAFSLIQFCYAAHVVQIPNVKGVIHR